MIPIIWDLNKNKEWYPSWICKECAESLGHPSRCQASSYHYDFCGWCDENKAVTEPRDYGYPPYQSKPLKK